MPTCDGLECYLRILGLRLDERLSMHYHWAYVVEVGARRVALLKRLLRQRSGAPSGVGRMLYQALVESVIAFALPVWGGRLDERRVARLHTRVINPACRAIL